MSGRLVISGKKSYCPWKRENVERVLCDERRSSEALEKQQQQQEQPWKKLLFANKDESSEDQAQHVNLFQDEERVAAAMSRATLISEKSKKRKAGVMPVFLDQRKGGAELPFYLRTSGAQKREEEKSLRSGSSRKDQKKKTQIDPMHAYHRGDNVPQRHHENASTASIKDNDDKESRQSAKREKKKDRKAKRRENRDKTMKSKSEKDKTVWQELRKRRLERETHEQRRQQEECRVVNNEPIIRPGARSTITKRRKVYNSQFNL